jgi:hypothetical protein
MSALFSSGLIAKLYAKVITSLTKKNVSDNIFYKKFLFFFIKIILHLYSIISENT